MTFDEFKDRGVEAALPAGGPKKLGPIALAVLTAALVAAAAQVASDCAHSLFVQHARNPSRLQRLRLRWGYVRPAVQRAIAETPGAEELDAWEMEGLTQQGLLGAAKGLSDPEFEALKAAARTGG